MNAILVPVKSFRKAKTRHSDWLDEAGRIRLARAMLGDVAEAVAACSIPAAMVSNDPWALRFARRLGWRTLVEPEQESESASVDWASRALAEDGFTRVLRVPADIPLVRRSDLTELLAAPLPTPGALIVPSRDGTGSNALLRTPPTLFPSRFGPDSFNRHREEARLRGIELKVVENPRIGLDLDQAEDLAAFWADGGGPRTRRVLRDIGGLGRARRR